jgi:hypothetical protein
MQKDTFQQIIFFIITTILIIETGKLVVGINNVATFNDFAAIMIFFTSLLLFMNYLIKLSYKLIKIINA